jgi:hypothetical protein
MSRTVDPLERPVPDVRLSADYKDHKGGDIVSLTDEEAREAPVRKVYPSPILQAPKRARKTTEPSDPSE